MMAFEQIPKKDWYSILGADPSASVSDLKQKYQKLILTYHPDKQSADAPAGSVEECIQKFIEIDQAWKILGDEEAKKEYDLQRHEDDLRNMGPVDARIYLEEMSWNEEYIMRNAGLEEAQAGIKTARRNINNVGYADDITLMAESEELKSLLKEESEKVGL
uniref:DnaJ heat shock protein family (Hsp40) member C24 n=1 Tax=Ovis aries TaxID=9940 RepID=A0AC11BGE9_SHEEP